MPSDHQARGRWEISRQRYLFLHFLGRKTWDLRFYGRIFQSNLNWPVLNNDNDFRRPVTIVTHQLHISSEVRARKTAQIRFWILGTTCSGGTRCRMAALWFVFCELFRGNLVLIVRPVVKPTCLCSSEYKRCLLLGHAAAPSLLLRTAGMLGTCG